MDVPEDYWDVRLRGRRPASVLRSTFLAQAIYPWPDMPSHWFIRIHRPACWRMAHWNPVADTVRIHLADRWSFSCPTGYEAWVRWNLLTEQQLVGLVEWPARRIHEDRLAAFRMRLMELMQQPLGV